MSEPGHPTRIVPCEPEDAASHVDAREVEIIELAAVPAQEVIFRALLVLMEAATEKVGATHEHPSESPYFDLDEARTLITALAGLVTASVEYLGPQASVIRNGLKNLQLAFREASVHPDEPGTGPGEKFTGPVH